MIKVLLSLTLFSVALSAVPASNKIESIASNLVKIYLNSENQEVSWYCFIDQAIELAQQANGSAELLAALKSARERNGAVSVAWGLRSVKTEIQDKLPQTYDMVRQGYSTLQLRTLVNALIERNGKAACEKTCQKDEL
jgi:hypothetical protein